MKGVALYQYAPALTMTRDEKLPDPHRREHGSPLRSFGRRRGRKLSPRQSSLLTGSIERLHLDLRQPPAEGGLGSLFTAPVDEIWLEIGFGAGEHMIWQAENNVHAGLIGAEPYVNGVVAALSAIEARKYEGRIRLHADDVHPLLEWLPPKSLSRAFMLFPDPWPKKRHRERRLFSPSLLDKMARILLPGRGTPLRLRHRRLRRSRHRTCHGAPGFRSRPDLHLREPRRAAGLARHPLRDEGLQSGAVFNIYRAETQVSFLNAPT